MEKITLLSGIEKYYDTAENNSWKFYYGSGIARDATELKMTFDKQDKYCEMDLHRVFGWFVRVKKDGKTQK